MKKIVQALFGILLTTSLFSQNNSIKIISTEDSVLNGKVYHVYGDAARQEIKDHFYVVLEGQDSSLIAIKRRELSVIAGTDEYFCWYLCYIPVAAGTKELVYAPDSLMLYDNDTVDNFSVYFRPKNNLGTACYRYIFQPEFDPGDSSWVDVCFDILTVGVEEADGSADISIYPNPASDVIYMNIEGSFGKALNCVFQLTDLSGKVVYDAKVIRGLNTYNLNEANLKSGAYMGIVKSDDRILSKNKILIQ